MSKGKVPQQSQSGAGNPEDSWITPWCLVYYESSEMLVVLSAREAAAAMTGKSTLWQQGGQASKRQAGWLSFCCTLWSRLPEGVAQSWVGPSHISQGYQRTSSDAAPCCGNYDVWQQWKLAIRGMFPGHFQLFKYFTICIYYNTMCYLECPYAFQNMK